MSSRYSSPGKITLGSLLLAGATFATTLPTWVHAQVNAVAESQVDVSGADAAPAVTSLALVFLAATVAVPIAGPVVRWVICGIMALASLGMIGSIISVILNPAAATLTEVGKATGMTGAQGTFTLTALPWIALTLAVLLLAQSIWTALASRSWATRRKYERKIHHAKEDLDEIDTWDSFTAGEDPTVQQK